MPRHPPIALKTLDRSHCQCPSVFLAHDPCPKVSQLLGVMCWTDVIGTKRPASRDLNGGAVRLTHHLPGIERPRRRTVSIITRPPTEAYGTSRTEFRTRNPNKSSLYDVVQNRRRAYARRKLFSKRMTLPPDDGGAGRDRTDDPLLAKQVLSQLSYGP